MIHKSIWYEIYIKIVIMCKPNFVYLVALPNCSQHHVKHHDFQNKTRIESSDKFRILLDSTHIIIPSMILLSFDEYFLTLSLMTNQISKNFVYGN